MLIDKYYKYLKDNNLNRTVVAPDSMTVENSEDDEGWIEWKLSKSVIDDNELKAIKTKYNIELPKEYLDFIKHKQFMDIQIGEYTIYGVNELKTLEKIISIFPADIIALSFIPIGSINDADFLALDAQSGEVVSLTFEDYKLQEVLFRNFHEFEEFLSKKI